MIAVALTALFKITRHGALPLTVQAILLKRGLPLVEVHFLSHSGVETQLTAHDTTHDAFELVLKSNAPMNPLRPSKSTP